MNKYASLGAFLFGVSFLAASHSSCSSGSSGAPAAMKPPAVCSVAGFKVCPADDPAAQASIDVCTSYMNDPTCGSTFSAYITCSYDHLSCTSSGHLDVATIEGICATQRATWQSCMSGGPPPDGGTGGCGTIGPPASSACETCLDTNCCAAKTTCANDPDCPALIACTTTCTGTACQDCYTTFPNGGPELANLCAGSGQPCQAACAF